LLFNTATLAREGIVATKERTTRAIARALLVVSIALVTAAPRPVPIKLDPHQQRKNLARATALLQSNQPLKVNAYYACILNDRAQGLSLAQAQDDCLARLQQDATQKSENPLDVLGLGAKQFFDPSKIVADCSPGSSKVSDSYGWQQTPGWGGYSWGGKPNDYYGYDQAKSKELKDKAIQEAKAADQRFSDAEAKADALLAASNAANKAVENDKKTGDAKKAAADTKKAADAKQAYDQAYKDAQRAGSDSQIADEKARQDPNQKPQNNNRPVGGDSPCETALQEAREILFECNRTDWKSADCRELWARFNSCPDPAQIMVDPDQGYVCGKPIDKAALKAAWIARCEQLKRFGPDGNPCQPPQLDPSGRFGNGVAGPICGDPQAYVLPGSRECYRVIEVRPFGELDLQQLIVWGLNKFGGPIIILNRNPPSPEPTGGPGGGGSPTGGEGSGSPGIGGLQPWPPN
jgi:hypothetical protein